MDVFFATKRHSIPLIECDYGDVVCKAVGIFTECFLNQDRSMVHALMKGMSLLPKHKFDFALMLLWELWLQMNNVLWEGRREDHEAG